MSRRARSRPDKRATALDLARMFGHGSELPSSDEPEPAVEFDHFEGQKAPTDPIKSPRKPNPTA